MGRLTGNYRATYQISVMIQTTMRKQEFLKEILSLQDRTILRIYSKNFARSAAMVFDGPGRGQPRAKK